MGTLAKGYVQTYIWKPAFLFIRLLLDFEVFDDKTFDDMFEDFFEAWSSLVMKCTAEGRDPKELEFLFAILDTFGKFLPSEASASSKKVSNLNFSLYVTFHVWDAIAIAWSYTG